MKHQTLSQKVMDRLIGLVREYKATEERIVVLGAIVSILIEYGFDANSALVVAVKAYEIA